VSGAMLAGSPAMSVHFITGYVVTLTYQAVEDWRSHRGHDFVLEKKKIITVS